MGSGPPTRYLCGVASQPSADATTPPTPPAPDLERLRGDGRPVGPGFAGIIAALVQRPADLLAEAHRPGRRPLARLIALSLATMLAVGLVVASFSGGFQLFAVPLKLCVGMVVCALLCLPSLYVFTSVAGAGQSVRETALALVMGVALTGVLLVALAPVTWLFSQSTDSSAVMGTLHVVAFLVSAWVGVRLIDKVMRAYNGRAIAGVRAWGFVFVVVMLQMTTTLRPLVGPFDGVWSSQRLFFVEHWAGPVASRRGR